MTKITNILSAIEDGDLRAADELLPLVYDELRRLAARKLGRESPGQTLQPTALVHEAYLRLVGPTGTRRYRDGRHFFAASATAMRRILVENARRKGTLKRGGDRGRLDLDAVSAPEAEVDLIALDEVLGKLEAQDSLKAKLVELRYFSGLTGDEAAAVLGISPSSADRHWVYARAWLRTQLKDG